MGSREGKEQIVASLTEQFKNAQAVVVVDYRGISVAQDTKLRKELRENGVNYVVLLLAMPVLKEFAIALKV